MHVHGIGREVEDKGNIFRGFLSVCDVVCVYAWHLNISKRMESKSGLREWPRHLLPYRSNPTHQIFPEFFFLNIWQNISLASLLREILDPPLENYHPK